MFLREANEIKLSKGWHEQPLQLATPLKKFVDYCVKAPSPLQIRVLSKGTHELSALFGFILFAGVLYPVVEVNWSTMTPMGFVFNRSFFYNRDGLAAFLSKSDFSLDDRDKRTSGKRRYLRGGEGRMTSEDFFAMDGSPSFYSMAIEHSMAIAVCLDVRREVLLNPPLRTFEFYKRVNSWQAYQEMSMFLGNIAAPDRVPSVVADKDRIAKHGFDKWSFRKRAEA